MRIGWIESDFLRDVHSPEAKRGIEKPIVTALWRHRPVTAEEVGDQDPQRHAEVRISAVLTNAARLTDAADSAEHAFAGHLEVPLLVTRRGRSIVSTGVRRRGRPPAPVKHDFVVDSCAPCNRGRALLSA